MGLLDLLARRWSSRAVVRKVFCNLLYKNANGNITKTR